MTDQSLIHPRLILLFCGKRKSGKDFLTEWLANHLNSNLDQAAVIMRLSGPLKQCYAENHGLDYARLLDASDYKEKYRKDMISWSEKIRHEDPAYFCLKAIDKYNGKDFPIWIISDCRRTTDFQFFESNYPKEICKRVRICASEEVRMSRGFVFQSGVDDAESECGLDEQNCDFTIENNGQVPPEKLLQDLLQYTKTFNCKETQ